MPFFEHETVPKEKISPNNIFVSVIASYSPDGDCRPLYFRYSHADGTHNDIPVERVVSKKPNSIFGTIYICEIVESGKRRQVCLYFHRAENKWSLRFV